MFSNIREKLQQAFSNNPDLEVLDERVEPIVMFHGTSSKFLPKILSYGLRADPPQKGFGSDITGGDNQENMDSVGGAYLTTNLLTASSAAHSTCQKYPGNSLYVICEIVQKSAHADEDDIRGILERAFEGEMKRNFGGYSAWHNKGIMDGKPEIVDGIIQDIAEKAHKELSNNNKKHPLDISLFKHYFQAKLNTLLYHTKDKPWNSVSDYFDGLGSVNREAANKFYDTKYKQWKETGIPFQDIKDIDASFKMALDKLSRRYRSSTTQGPADRLSLRVTNDVMFNGRNKIICIVEEIRRKDLSIAGIKVHYGKVPEKFIKDWKAVIGKFPKELDKNFDPNDEQSQAGKDYDKRFSSQVAAESSLDGTIISKIRETFGATTNDIR